MKQSEEWPAAWTAIIGQAIRARRKELGWSAQNLSDRCGELDCSIPRNTIANLENGRKESIPVHEIAVLARALFVPPIELLFPADVSDTVTTTPAHPEQTMIDAMHWFDGVSTYRPGPSEWWTEDRRRELTKRPDRLFFWRQYFDAAQTFVGAAYLRDDPEVRRSGEAPTAEDLMRAAARFVNVRERLRLEGVRVPHLGELAKQVVTFDVDKWAKANDDRLNELSKAMRGSRHE